MVVSDEVRVRPHILRVLTYKRDLDNYQRMIKNGVSFNRAFFEAMDKKKVSKRWQKEQQGLVAFWEKEVGSSIRVVTNFSPTRFFRRLEEEL